LYTILLFLYLYLFVRIVAQGPGDAHASPAAKEVA
jgi:cytochrome bd-type quinol oxidase subunit 1